MRRKKERQRERERERVKGDLTDAEQEAEDMKKNEGERRTEGK